MDNIIFSLKNKTKIFLMYLFIVLTLLILPQTSQACYMPKKGFNWDMTTLAEFADTILLVRADTIEANYATFKIIETLKGDTPEILMLYGVNSLYENNDFKNHTDNVFWESNIGRSFMDDFSCGPNHTFKKDTMYLLFPNHLGARKSAEIINSYDDKWLQYVRERL